MVEIYWMPVKGLMTNDGLVLPATYLSKRSEKSVIEIDGVSYESVIIISFYGIGLLVKNHEDYSEFSFSEGIIEAIDDVLVHELTHTLVKWKHEKEIFTITYEDA